MDTSISGPIAEHEHKCRVCHDPLEVGNLCMICAREYPELMISDWKELRERLVRYGLARE